MGKWTRRAFIGTGTLVGGGMALGLVGFAVAPGRHSVVGDDAAASGQLNTWILVTPDNVVTVLVPHCEMGQGAQTALAMMAADEMDADWNLVRVKEAPALDEYANAYVARAFTGSSIPGPLQRGFDYGTYRLVRWFGVQVTGGSLSVRTTGHYGMRVAGAAAGLGTVRKEGFDDTILERMKRNHDQPPAGLETPFGCLQGFGEFAELVVHKNAQGLKRARGRMDVADARTDDGCHDLGKLMRRRDRRNGPCIDDGACNRARMPFFAERENDAGEVTLARRLDHVGCACTLPAHAHVERSVEPEREPALGGIELHGRNTEVQHDPVDMFVAGLARDGIEIGKPVLDQRQAAASLFDEIGAQCECRLVAVNADHLAVGGCENGARVASCTERPVDVHAAFANIEEVDSLAAEHGNVGGGSASDSRAAAARHHSRAPGALRAAWKLRSSLSARTFRVASASSCWNRLGSQIWNL